MARRDISFPEISPLAERPAGTIPSVVIVGRPNVGKSSLLNCLARKRISIVDPMAGVTRDRISALVQYGTHLIELWDTGGIGTPDDLAAEVETQIEIAIVRADLVLFVVDAQQGMVPLDQEIANRLRRIGRPVVLVANKVEHAKHALIAAEFAALGFKHTVNVSATHSFGRTDLLDALVSLLPAGETSAPAEPLLRLAIVGRQNVGKSTLINTLAGENRVIVSDLPGTTRDAVDVRFVRDGKSYLAVDTAGLKRKSKLADSVEFYALARAARAIRRCDVALFMVDVTAEISRVDKQLASTIEADSKPCIITVNKWDLAHGKFTTEEYIKYLNDHLSGLAFAPVSFICAKKEMNVGQTLELAQSLHDQARRQAPTAQVNAVIQLAVQTRAPELSHGKRPNLLYGTQIAVAPPTFLIFASHPHLISDQYNRFLANFLRRNLPFPEIPLRILYRARNRKADDAHKE